MGIIRELMKNGSEMAVEEEGIMMGYVRQVCEVGKGGG